MGLPVSGLCGTAGSLLCSLPAPSPVSLEPCEVCLASPSLALNSQLSAPPGQAGPAWVSTVSWGLTGTVPCHGPRTGWEPQAGRPSPAGTQPGAHVVPVAGVVPPSFRIRPGESRLSRSTTLQAIAPRRPPGQGLRGQGVLWVLRECPAAQRGWQAVRGWGGGPIRRDDSGAEQTGRGKGAASRAPGRRG